MANPNAILRKGLKQHEAGELDSAARHYREVIRIKPRHVDALYLLGTLLAEQGKLDEAEIFLSQASALNPKSHQILNNLANVCRLQGKLGEALMHFQAMVRLAPDFLDGRVNYAMTLVAHGNATHNFDLIRQARKELTGILSVRPDHALSLLAMGNIYKDENDYEAAQKYYEKVLSYIPEHFDAHLRLAEIFIRQGRFEEGKKNAEAALVLRPGNIKALTELARQFQYSGQAKRAAEILAQPVRDGETYVPALAAYATSLVQSRSDHDSLHEAVALLEAADSRQTDAVLCFCLGDIYDSLEEYNKAFACYKQGNQLDNRHVAIDMTAHEKLVADLMRLFTDSSLASAKKARQGGENLIFIVGMPRSGSTLVEQILISHPLVKGVGESYFLSRAKDAHLDANQLLDEVENLDVGALDRMAEDYFSYLPDESRQANKITDKTLANYLEIGMIKQIFPDARILHCLRNPLDTCLSCYIHNFAGRDINFTHDLEILGRYYVLYRRLMQHWKSLYQDDIMELRYEELVAEPPRIVKAMLAFCGLEMDEACLAFYRNPRYAGTLSYDQVRQPIYKKAVGRHQHYEQFLSPLKLALAGYENEFDVCL